MRSIPESAHQCVRRFPRSSVPAKQNGGVENIILVVGRFETAIERGLCAGPLLLEEAFRIHAAIVVEAHHGKGAADHTRWSAPREIDDQVGHADSLPRDAWQHRAIQVAKHPVELCVRHAIEVSIASDEKSAERHCHGFTPPIH